MDHATGDTPVANRLLGERDLQTELRRPGGERGIDFGHDERKIGKIAIDEIPTIGAEFVMHIVDEAFRSIKADRFLATDQQPQQAIKPDEMIDMRMGDEDMSQPLDLARR